MALSRQRLQRAKTIRQFLCLSFMTKKCYQCYDQHVHASKEPDRGEGGLSGALIICVKNDFFADQNPRKSSNRSSEARFETFTGLIPGKKIV